MRVVLDGSTFLLTRDDGRLDSPDGLYHRDARHLSELVVELDGADLVPLHHQRHSRSHRSWRYVTSSSSINRLAETGDQRPSDFVLLRDEVVREGTGLDERFVVTNYSGSRRETRFEIGFDVDFTDLFEARELIPPRDREVDVRVDGRTVVYRYEFEDVGGETVELFSAVGTAGSSGVLKPGRASYSLTLDPQESTTVYLAVRPGVTTPVEVGPETFADARESAEAPYDPTSISPGSDRLAETAVHSLNDLRALSTVTPDGPIPVAGVPWFATVFGRDTLLTSYLMLPFVSEFACATLRYLAAHQGETVDEYREEEPGKIFHEIRHGEPARTGQIPHASYYGSVDATPLWIVLLHETYRWTGDDRLVRDLWESFEAAVTWLESAIDAYGDDPFLYYGGRAGLPHKAWRDTPESVQYADGELAEPPLASTEVQGYAYDALRRAGELVRQFQGDGERASTFRTRADRLGDAFHEQFWMADESFFAAALTESGDQVDSVTSNVGHGLWSGIVDDDSAAHVADRLLAEDMFSGWGVRTMSERNAGYSPVSYHTGSVWPHDNAMIVLGLDDYGYTGSAERVTAGLVGAFERFDDPSVPELFAGFDDRIDPAPYPAACRPQAWAASAPFGLVRAICDVRPGNGRYARLETVPDGIDTKAIEGLLSLEHPLNASDD